MTQGDVAWVTLPSGAGRAQAGRRPAIVLQNDETSRKIPTALVVPLTTQKDALRFPGTVLVEPDDQNGLKHPSVALVFQLTTIDQKFIEGRLGTASGSVLASLLAALNDITEM
jgi:mRNA-degrading endonuclease toxin of MazEF toxin-antitoxin module